MRAYLNGKLVPLHTVTCEHINSGLVVFTSDDPHITPAPALQREWRGEGALFVPQRGLLYVGAFIFATWLYSCYVDHHKPPPKPNVVIEGDTITALPTPADERRPHRNN